MLVFGRSFVETEKKPYFYPEELFGHPQLFAIDQADDLHPGMRVVMAPKAKAPIGFDVNRAIPQKNKDQRPLASLPQRHEWRARRDLPPKGRQHGEERQNHRRGGFPKHRSLQLSVPWVVFRREQ